MNTLTEITPLILAGDGYRLTIAQEAIERKEELLRKSNKIEIVSNNDESGDAQYYTRRLAQMRIEVEKSRKAVKEPVQVIGKLIDQTAANFLVEITKEENRIRKLVGDHAERVARIQAEKESEERKAFESARLAREEFERAQDAAEATGRIKDILAAKQADKERQDALTERLAASTEVAANRIASGVRFAWDFEVINIGNVYRNAPEFVELEIKRSAVLAWFRELESADEDVSAAACLLGIRAFRKTIVSSR